MASYDAAVRTAILGLATFVAVACGAEGPEDAGDQIERWSAVEDLRIGSMDDERYAFTWFRSMVVGPSGRIFTLHPQEQLVRVFDTTGEIENTIGGRGDGPTEFQNAVSLGWLDDRLWVMDADGYAFKFFTPEGEFVESFSVPFVMERAPDGSSPPRADGLLSDGTVHGSPPAWSNDVATGVLTQHQPLLMTRDGQVTESLPAIPFGNNTWAVHDPDNPDSGGSYGTQPFADGPLWSYVEGERAVLHLNREAPEAAETAEFSLTKLAFSGDTLWTRRYPYTPQPLLQAEIDSVIEARAAPLGESGFLGLTVARARDWAGLTLYAPPLKSHVASMVVGRDGGIWVETLRPTDSPGETEWLVLDAEGEPRARVVLPTDLTVLVADEEHVWGSLSDEFDVPYVVRYSLAPSASTGG